MSTRFVAIVRGPVGPAIAKLIKGKLIISGEDTEYVFTNRDRALHFLRAQRIVLSEEKCDVTSLR